jgi:hypothetical protein
LLKLDYSGFCDMKSRSRSELISAERELNETKALIDQQYGIVKRLKWLGADNREAIVLLLNLLDLQQSRERRLSYLRMRGTDRSSGKFKNKQLED